jgi:hypothetical protein
MRRSERTMKACLRWVLGGFALAACLFVLPALSACGGATVAPNNEETIRHANKAWDELDAAPPQDPSRQ